VSHRLPELELWFRRGEGKSFERTVAGRGERLKLRPFEIELAVDEIYAGVIDGL
jgi:hypothetical protein